MTTPQGEPLGPPQSHEPSQVDLPEALAQPSIVPLPELVPQLAQPSSAVPPSPSARAERAGRAERVERAPRAQRPVGAPGLTAPGVAVIVFAGSLVGMLLDVFTGGGVGWLFGVVFITTSGYAALQVRRADRAAALIAPPLVFAVLVMTDKFIGSAGDMIAKSVGALNGLLDYGPMLWIGSGLTVVIIGVKVWQERRRHATSDRAAAPVVAQTADAPPPS